ncbi:MAG: hypothetical protein IJ734_03090, partial [Fibrobacter sp.]|nr:hypothetical protein [Fibrobacter sp.]
MFSPSCGGALGSGSDGSSVGVSAGVSGFSGVLFYVQATCSSPVVSHIPSTVTPTTPQVEV